MAIGAPNRSSDKEILQKAANGFVPARHWMANPSTMSAYEMTRKRLSSANRCQHLQIGRTRAMIAGPIRRGP